MSSAVTRVWGLIGLIVSVLALGACAPEPDATADRDSRAVYRSLVAGDLGGLEARLAPEGRTGETKALLAQMKAYVPVGAAPEPKAVWWQTRWAAGGPRTVTMVHDYRYPDRVVKATTVLRYGAERRPPEIITFNIQVATNEQLAVNDLTLTGKGPAPYLAAAGAVMCLGLILGALVRWVRVRGLRRRWLWLPFILLGVGRISVVWSTGQIGFQPLSIALFGVGVVKGGSAFDPWIVSLSLPLGAILFLLTQHGGTSSSRRRDRSGRPPVELAPEAPPQT